MSEKASVKEADDRSLKNKVKKFERLRKIMFARMLLLEKFLQLCIFKNKVFNKKFLFRKLIQSILYFIACRR
jgi:hypothetical protein